MRRQWHAAADNTGIRSRTLVGAGGRSGGLLGLLCMHEMLLLLYVREMRAKRGSVGRHCSRLLRLGSRCVSSLGRLRFRGSHGTSEHAFVLRFAAFHQRRQLRGTAAGAAHGDLQALARGQGPPRRGWSLGCVRTLAGLACRHWPAVTGNPCIFSRLDAIFALATLAVVHTDAAALAQFTDGAHTVVGADRATLALLTATADAIVRANL